MAKRKILTFDNVSAEGHFTGEGGSLDWVIPCGEATAAAMKAAPNVDAMLFGRTTYEMFERGWRDKDVDPHTGKATAESRQMSAWINERTKVVVSKTLEAVTWRNSRLVRALDAETIESLKKENAGDMIIFGSGSIASRLTELGLVDEYTFIVNPTFIGTGRALIANLESRVKLRLLEAQAFPSTGHVMLRYARA